MSERKTLLPELLPTPTATGARTPAERVAERALAYLRRFRGLGPAAGAALIGLQACGYQVVDPLPPPSGCEEWGPSLPDPTVVASFVPGTPRPRVEIDVYGADGAIEVTQVRGGTVKETTDGADSFTITIAPASDTATLLIDLDFAYCDTSITKHYRIDYHLPGADERVLAVVEVQ